MKDWQSIAMILSIIMILPVIAVGCIYYDEQEKDGTTVSGEIIGKERGNGYWIVLENKTTKKYDVSMETYYKCEKGDNVTLIYNMQVSDWILLENDRLQGGE